MRTLLTSLLVVALITAWSTAVFAQENGEPAEANDENNENDDATEEPDVTIETDDDEEAVADEDNGDVANDDDVNDFLPADNDANDFVPATNDDAPIEELMTGRVGLGFNVNLSGNAATTVSYWLTEELVLNANLGIFVVVDPDPVNAHAGFFLGIGVIYNFIYDPGKFYFGVGGHLDLGVIGTPGNNTRAEFVLSVPLNLEYFIHPQVSFTLQFGIMMRFADAGVFGPLGPGGLGSDFALFLGNRGEVAGLAGFTVYFD